jgi:hypothetical protein
VVNGLVVTQNQQTVVIPEGQIASVAFQCGGNATSGEMTTNTGWVAYWPQDAVNGVVSWTLPNQIAGQGVAVSWTCNSSTGAAKGSAWNLWQ